MNVLFDYMTESELERAQEDAVYEYEAKVFDNKLLLCEMAHQERLLKIEAEVAENCYGSDVLLGLYNKEMEYYQESVGEAINNFFSWLAEQIGKLFGKSQKAEEIANAAIKEPSEKEKLIKASQEIDPDGFEVPFDPEQVLKVGESVVQIGEDTDNLLIKEKGKWHLNWSKLGAAAFMSLDLGAIFTAGKNIMTPKKINLEYVLNKLYQPLRNIIRGIENICNKYKNKKGKKNEKMSKKEAEDAEKANIVRSFYTKFTNLVKSGWNIVTSKVVEASHKAGGIAKDIVGSVANLFTSDEEKNLVEEYRKIDKNDKKALDDFVKKLNGTKFSKDYIARKAAQVEERENRKNANQQERDAKNARKNAIKKLTSDGKKGLGLKDYKLVNISDPASQLSQYDGHYCIISTAENILKCNDSSKLTSKVINFSGARDKWIKDIKNANKAGKLIFIKVDSNKNESSYFDEIIDEFESINEEYEDSASIDDLITESADSDNFSGILELIESL